MPQHAVDIQIRRLDGTTQVTISGVIDEMADLSSLAELSGNIQINLKDVRRFNSAGVRNWIDVLREIAPKSHLVFVECAPPVIDQLNMIHGFLGSGVVQSFYGVMVCEHCDASRDHLFETNRCRDLDRLERVTCDECGRTMELDEGEDQYLLFLREPTFVAG